MKSYDLNLLTALNKPDVSVSEIEDLVKHDLTLSYRVLRSINSASFGLRREVTSIRQALVLLGIDSIDAQQAKETLHILLKYQSDIAKAAKELSVDK